jgi:uncharacterized protein (TIGR00645 family)
MRTVPGRKKETMKISHAVESVIFRGRWLLAPMYLGLLLVLIVLAYKFVLEIIDLIIHVPQEGKDRFILDLLGLLDLVLLGNLIVIVLFAGYENFVSKIEAAQNDVDRPGWMGTVDFSGLKIKLIGSIVAISVIELLANFVELGLGANVGNEKAIFWRIVIHLTFVISGVLFAVMDWLNDSRAASLKGPKGGSELGSSNSAV